MNAMQDTVAAHVVGFDIPATPGMREADIQTLQSRIFIWGDVLYLLDALLYLKCWYDDTRPAPNTVRPPAHFSCTNSNTVCC